jgi:hypothetical protein
VGAADRIGGKRVKAILPRLLHALEQHGHLALDATVRERPRAASPATIDRLLASMRDSMSTRKKRRHATKPSKQVPIRIFADWKAPLPGSLEIDFVSHCGSSMHGTFLWSLVATDVSSGWTEMVPLLARAIPGHRGTGSDRPATADAVRGIDPGKDSAFCNDTLLAYCPEQRLAFTRSRAYQKYD